MKSHRRSAGLCLTVALVLPVLGSCGSDPDAAPAASTVATTTASTTSTTSTTPTTSTTSATSTTSTTSTSTSTPTTTSTPVGWMPIDPPSVTGQLSPPCCADTWHGDPSPPLGSADQQVVDGDYPVRGEWPDRSGEPLRVDVYRFEQCGVLPEFSCEPREGSYDPDQLGIDESVARVLTVPLDGSVRVVVAGFAADQERSDIVVEQATGTEMATLVAEVDQAYSEVFASRFAAGEDPDAIVADVRADPVGGFGPQDAGGVGALEFVSDAGPPLLFQHIFPYEDGQRVVGRGSDVLTIRSIEVVDGQVTVYVYASYYP